MTDKRIERINKLAKKSRTVGLSEQEKAEQAELRKEYIEAFKNSLSSTLENVVIVDKEGNKTSIKKKEK